MMKKQQHKTGFKIPEGYFETLEDRVIAKIAETKFPKSAGFQTPEGYFENFEDGVLQDLLSVTARKKVIKLNPRKYLGYAAAIAASILVAFMIFSPTSNPSLETIQAAAIDGYIEDGNLNIDLYELTSYMDDADLSDLNFKNQQFSANILKNYLLETIDEETLILER